jgi:hypothetical protein
MTYKSLIRFLVTDRNHSLHRFGAVLQTPVRATRNCRFKNFHYDFNLRKWKDSGTHEGWREKHEGAIDTFVLPIIGSPNKPINLETDYCPTRELIRIRKESGEDDIRC